MNIEFETDFLIKSCKLFGIYATSDAINYNHHDLDEFKKNNPACFNSWSELIKHCNLQAEETRISTRSEL